MKTWFDAHISLARVVSLLFFLALLWFVVTASGYNAKARFVPLVIGIPALALAVYQFQSDWRKPIVREAPPEGTKGPSLTRREWESAGWVIACFALVWLVGFTYGLPIFAYVYAKVRGKEGWLISLIPAVGSFLVLWFLFAGFLHVSLFQGVVFDLLAG